MSEIQPGTRLGPYEIVAPLGQGGMGEVYRGRDTRLDRLVAIKVLPAALADDPTFRERFDREAHVISALSHPHICPLFDVGRQGGVSYLVLEYLDGESLEARLQKGPLKIDDALRIAVEIAGALDAAHRAGIVHRDLKPANVVLTKAGAKLLDFGLAKPSAPAVAVSGPMAPTTPVGITAQGTILGTFQYMAPEQIEGVETDARTDIFAFGCVLFEMLTGRKAFEGTRASLIGAILKDDPPAVSSVQPLTPASIDRIVTTCLAKDPDDRWQSARDLMRELRWTASGATAAAVVRPGALGRRSVAPWALAGALAIALATVVALWAPWRVVPTPAPVRVSVELGVDASLAIDLGASAIVSPDGRTLVFAAQKSSTNQQQLYVRRLEHLQASPLSGTEDASNPFFSPDGQWVGFFANGKLKKVPVTGGAAVTIADALNGRGGTWGEDGSILFLPDSITGIGLRRVSSAGGASESLAKLGPDEATQRFPQVLPGGKAVLYTSSSQVFNFDEASIVVQPLPSGPPKVVQRGGYYGRFVRSGHLLYVHDGTLFAAPFDLDALQLTGPSAPVLEGLASNVTTGGAQLSVSDNGTLATILGQGISSASPISWMDRSGRITSMRATPSIWTTPQFSADGRRLVLDIIDDGSDIWVYDWARDTLSRVTFDPAVDRSPAWTPDGRRLAFSSDRTDKVLNLYWQAADGTGQVQRLTESKNSQYVSSWHPSGRFLAFYESSPQTGDDLMILPVEGDEVSGWKPGKPFTYLNSKYTEQKPTFSPDGRWIAYTSNEAGRTEVYVRPFAIPRTPSQGAQSTPAGKWQISTGGGNDPAWSRPRKQLLFRTTGGATSQIMVADYSVENGSFRAEKPQVWSPGRLLVPRIRSFDLHPDGERVVVSAVLEQTAKLDKVVLTFNFFDELRRIAPVTK